MKKWPEYKQYRRNCRNAWEVNAFLKSLDLVEYDSSYLENTVRGRGIEEDFDSWLDTEEATDWQGASVQIEYIQEYNPLDRPAYLMDDEIVFRASMGENVKEPAHYEVRITKYTKAGLEARYPETI